MTEGWQPSLSPLCTFPPPQVAQFTSSGCTETKTWDVNQEYWSRNGSAYHGQARWLGKPTLQSLCSDMVMLNVSVHGRKQTPVTSPAPGTTPRVSVPFGSKCSCLVSFRPQPNSFRIWKGDYQNCMPDW